jgi:hypothetical protein
VEQHLCVSTILGFLKNCDGVTSSGMAFISVPLNINNLVEKLLWGVTKCVAL